MSVTSSSGEEDFDASRYPQMNADLSMPGATKEKINVLVTGFGPFDCHTVNASWEAVKQLAQLGVAHNVNLITVEIPVDYKVVQQLIPNLWETHQPELVVHVGVSPIANEVTFETVAHNNGYKAADISGNSAPSQCYDPDNGDDCLKTHIDVDKLCNDVNQKGCLAMVTKSYNAGRYLCEYTFYASLCQNASRTIFVHVPVLGEPYSDAELGHALKCSIQCMLEQLNLQSVLPPPDAETMELMREQISGGDAARIMP